MSQELRLGKYEFYPYTDEDFKDATSLEELLEEFRKISEQGEEEAEEPE